VKVVVCAVRGDLHLFSFGPQWTRCQCGATAAKWDDAIAGTMAVASREPDKVFVIGLVNSVLIEMLQHGLDFSDFRGLHDHLTKDLNAYVFHESQAGCWAVPFTPGRTLDSRWASAEEMEEAGL
jgi:hypothetical protein